MSTRVSILAAVLLTFASSGCGPGASAPDAETRDDLAYLASKVSWAVNVGGPAYHGVDGVHYFADDGVFGGEVGGAGPILGSQDSLLFQSYRMGDIEIEKPIENGVYDIFLRFAEPFDLPVGSRVFTVIAEDTPVIKDLDVRRARDGKHLSGLDYTATGIEVSDGGLSIRFEATVGEPILSGLVVRPQGEDTRAWELVWGDEFDYTGPPDSSRWNFDLWPPRKVNDEDQAYTDRPENVRVADGSLIIEAHNEPYDGGEYTSGRIHSAGKGDFLYGRFDIRAKLPAGQGSWPAIWMLPTDPYRYATLCGEGTDWQGSATCDAWPNSGEIDIMEHVGFDMNTVWGTVHTEAYYWLKWQQRKGAVQAKSVDGDFHVYSLEWNPEFITISMDGSPYFTYVNEGSGWRAWPFDHPFHLILNVAIGGAWGRAGGPIDDSIFPIRMEVDYVRVYERG